MDRSVRIGVELPVLPVGAGADRVASWRSIAVAAEQHGAGAVWIADGGCDPCTLAGGLVPATGRVVLGVVCDLAGGRHPAVLARDVTALDVTSGGRAGVLVEGAQSEVDEAVTICRALFAGQTLELAGQHYDVAGAVNRPAPIRPGGPVLLAQPRTTAPAAKFATAASIDSPAVDCVVTGRPDEIDVGRLRQGGAVLWRGRVLDDHFAGDLHRTGVDGVIALVETADEVGSLVDRLVARWTG